MAKAVCPKCKRIFGDNPLHEITLIGSDEELGEETGEEGMAKGVWLTVREVMNKGDKK